MLVPDQRGTQAARSFVVRSHTSLAEQNPRARVSDRGRRRDDAVMCATPDEVPRPPAPAEKDEDKNNGAPHGAHHDGITG